VSESIFVCVIKRQDIRLRIAKGDDDLDVNRLRDTACLLARLICQPFDKKSSLDAFKLKLKCFLSLSVYIGHVYRAKLIYRLHG